MTLEKTTIKTIRIFVLLLLIVSCNNPKKINQAYTDKNKMNRSINFYLLNYKEKIESFAKSESFNENLQLINDTIIKVLPGSLHTNQYTQWREKISGIDSTNLLIKDLYSFNYCLQYYLKLNMHLKQPDFIQSYPRIEEIQKKVSRDAFFIKNGFGFYQSYWYLHPVLNIDDESFENLKNNSELFSSVLRGESNDMTELTCDWIKKEDDDGIPLNSFRIINISLAKRLSKELQSKFLNRKNANYSFSLLNDFLNKEVNKKAVILIEYIE